MFYLPFVSEEINVEKWRNKRGDGKFGNEYQEGFTKSSKQRWVGSMPTSNVAEVEVEVEVDRMPINSVGNPLLNPHE